MQTPGTARPAAALARVLAQARKELTQTARDRLTLALALALPLLQLWLLGSAVSLSVTDLPVAVRDLDGTPSSRRYADAVARSLTYRVVPDSGGGEAPLDRGEARAVVVIPGGFERDLLRGRVAEVQWLVDGTDANTATLLRANAAAVTAAFGGGAGEAPVRVAPRVWFNPGRDSDKYVGPAVFAIGLALFPALLAVLAMARESEQRTILQVYVSGVSAFEFLAGKTLAFLLIASAEWALTLGLAVWMFGLTLAGGPGPFLAGSCLYLFCSVAFGVVLGVRVPDQASAIQAVQNVGFLLSYLLSGFVYPISNIPAGLRWLSYLVPARYFIEVSRDAFVRGGGWPAVWHGPLALALLGGLFFLSAWVRMRPMQEDV
jgi:ABC-2 type transport system permease protein